MSARGSVRRRTFRVWFSRVVLLTAVLVAPAWSVTAREVLDHARRLTQTTRKWTDRLQRLSLRIVDRRGNARERALDVYVKRYDQDRSRSLLFFRSPPDVKGIGLLQWVDPHGENQQWLYLPELRRVRRISGGSSRSSFVGTDFSFEDLAIMAEILDWSDADAAVTLQREEPCAALSCWVLEFEPKGKDLAYTRIRLWLDADYRQQRFEFLGAKGEVDKALELTEYRTVGAIPTAFRMEMRNLRGGSHTIVDFGEVRYDTGIDDGVFSQGQLEKGL
jgi:outer membrane lipoprotein-sorting protein